MSQPKRSSTKLQKLAQKREALLEEQRKLAKQMLAERNRLAAYERKRETRRKIIDGAHIRELEEGDDYIRTKLREMRESKLIRDDDRELFGLAPLSEEEKKRRAERN